MPMKIRNFLLILSFAAFLASCTSQKNAHNQKNWKPVERTFPTKTVERTADLRNLDSKFSGKNSAAIEKILRDAEKYLGAPYKFGGNDSKGFDCSGYTVKVFEENEYRLPRRSADQAETGNRIDIAKVRPGDLLFFATGSTGQVSHVGIVHDIGNDGEVKFIHASTSKGVIISSLNEKYWNKSFLHAQRIF